MPENNATTLVDLDEQNLSEVRFGRNRFLRGMGVALFGLVTGMMIEPEEAEAAPYPCYGYRRCRCCRGYNCCGRGCRNYYSCGGRQCWTVRRACQQEVLRLLRLLRLDEERVTVHLQRLPGQAMLLTPDRLEGAGSRLGGRHPYRHSRPPIRPGKLGLRLAPSLGGCGGGRATNASVRPQRGLRDRKFRRASGPDGVILA